MHRWIAILSIVVCLYGGDLDAMLRLQEKAAAALLAWRLDPVPESLQQAGEAIASAAVAQPGNPVTLRLRSELQLARRQFGAAREDALLFNKQTPDDLEGYRLIVESCLVLGCYEEAEKAGQWMLDLRAKDPVSLRTAAKLRELWGDFDGAADALTQALQRIQPQQVADRAAVLAHLGSLELAQGRLEPASQLAEQAGQLAPRMAETVQLRVAVRRARGEGGEPDYEALANHAADGWERVEALLYLQRNAEALVLAESEISARQDVRTRAAMAWTLFANGQPQRAWEQFSRILQTGHRDAVVFHRAGCVAYALGRKAEARRLWQKSLDLNPYSTVAKQAELRLHQ